MGPASSQTHTVRGTARFLLLGTVPAQDLPGAQEPAGSGQGDQWARGSGMRWEENMERHGRDGLHREAGVAGLHSSGGPRGGSVPCLFQLPPAAHSSWLVAPSSICKPSRSTALHLSGHSATGLPTAGKASCLLRRHPWSTLAMPWSTLATHSPHIKVLSLNPVAKPFTV